MTYPRYPKELDRRCKLSLIQIRQIRVGYGIHTQKELGIMFGVSQAAISQTLLSPEEKKRRNRLHYLRYKGNYKYTAETRKEVRHRKRTLQLLKIREYYHDRDTAMKKRRKANEASM